MRNLYRVVVLAAVAAVAVLFPAFAYGDPSTIRMKDDCDPVSFNLAVPSPPGQPPTCVGNGGTTFDDFIGQLVNHQFAGAWRFSPGHLKIDAGSSLRMLVWLSQLLLGPPAPLQTWTKRTPVCRAHSRRTWVP